MSNQKVIQIEEEVQKKEEIQNEEEIQKKDDLQKVEDLQNEEVLKKEDDVQTEEYLQNEEVLKKEEEVQIDEYLLKVENIQKDVEPLYQTAQKILESKSEYGFVEKQIEDLESIAKIIYKIGRILTDKNIKYETIMKSLKILDKLANYFLNKNEDFQAKKIYLNLIEKRTENIDNQLFIKKCFYIWNYIDTNIDEIKKNPYEIELLQKISDNEIITPEYEYQYPLPIMQESSPRMEQNFEKLIRQSMAEVGVEALKTIAKEHPIIVLELVLVGFFIWKLKIIKRVNNWLDGIGKNS